jgi:hypothetical protein
MRNSLVPAYTMLRMPEKRDREGGQGQLGLLFLLHDRLIATGGHFRLLFFGQFQPGLSHVD